MLASLICHIHLATLIAIYVWQHWLSTSVRRCCFHVMAYPPIWIWKFVNKTRLAASNQWIYNPVRIQLHLIQEPQLLNMGSRCRLCAEYSEELLDTLEDISLPGKIEHLFQVKIVSEDHFTYICSPCHQIVLNTWDYSERVHKAQEILLEAEIASETIACDPIACDPIGCDPQLPQISDSELLKVECVIPVNLPEPQPGEPSQEVDEVQPEPQRRVSVRTRTKASKLKVSCIRFIFICLFLFP